MLFNKDQHLFFWRGLNDIHMTKMHKCIQYIECMSPISAQFVAGVVIKRWGCRPASMLAGSVACAGYILSFYAPNIWVLYITYGLTGNIGLIYIKLCFRIPHNKKPALLIKVSPTAKVTLFHCMMLHCIILCAVLQHLTFPSAEFQIIDNVDEF